MIWIAPSEKDTATAALEKRLWDAGTKCEVRSIWDEVRSGLPSSFILQPSPHLPAEARFDYVLTACN